MEGLSNKFYSLIWPMRSFSLAKPASIKLPFVIYTNVGNQTVS